MYPQRGIDIVYEKKIVKMDYSGNGDCAYGCSGTLYSTC